MPQQFHRVADTEIIFPQPFYLFVRERALGFLPFWLWRTQRAYDFQSVTIPGKFAAEISPASLRERLIGLSYNGTNNFRGHGLLVGNATWTNPNRLDTFLTLKEVNRRAGTLRLDTEYVGHLGKTPRYLKELWRIPYVKRNLANEVFELGVALPFFMVIYFGRLSLAALCLTFVVPLENPRLWLSPRKLFREWQYAVDGFR